MVNRVALAGQLLIAMPALADSNFSRGVVLICQHDDNGAMGVLINRESDYRLGEVLEQMGIATPNRTLAGQRVMVGGPVSPDNGFVVHADGSSWASTLHVDQRLALTTSRDILEAMAKGDGPSRTLMALGFAGWDAGQLEAELLDNAWLTAPADSELLFSVPVDQRWQAAAGRLGVDPGRLTDYTGRA